MQPEFATNLSLQGALTIQLSGDWLLSEKLPSSQPIIEHVEKQPPPQKVAFDSAELGQWDTGLIIFLLGVHRQCKTSEIEIDDDGLPDGVSKLIKLAFVVPERLDAHKQKATQGFLHRIGLVTLSAIQQTAEMLDFTGQLVLSAGRLFRGKATYSRQDLFQYIQQAGAEALPIVGLISLLIGMIFAFVGATQLKMLGAGIYTADLVGIAMVREMAPIMTAIIVAGRTGAAYAAEIGTMKVNEEIDALTSMGINTIDYLVMPRVIALIIMMPLLTIYADLLGIIGGMIVSISTLDVSIIQYLERTTGAITLNHLFGGLFKSIVYGSLIAIAGCLQGMNCGSSALAVGQQTTKAVVMGIVLTVVSASLLTIIYINLGI